MASENIIGLVADVGGTNTRLALVSASGVIETTIEKRPNSGAPDFQTMVLAYLAGRACPPDVVIAVAGPVAGKTARLTNRDWHFDADSLTAALKTERVTLINDLEALGHAVPTVPADAVEPLHEGAMLGRKGQAIVVGLGTGFNVSPVQTATEAVLSCELGHASLPASVKDYLSSRLPTTAPFETVENLFAGVGLLRLGRVMGLDYDTAEAIGRSDDPRAREAMDICTEAFGLMVREIAYMYFPRAGLFFNGSLAKVLLAPDRRERVLAPLRADHQFGGQFARLPAFLFVSDTVALGGCAAVVLGHVRQMRY